MKTCVRCLLDNDKVPELTFNSKGECSFCMAHDQFEESCPRGSKGQLLLNKLVERIKKDCEGKYDCVVGVSGGCDSSFLLAKTVELGLRPLAVHWNNGWNTEKATRNIHKMVDGLTVDYYEYRVNREEYDDLCHSFLLASVPDADIPNDIALTTVMYYACEKFGVKHMLNAHSFRTEGMCPLSWSYMDGKYVGSVQSKYGHVPFKTFPNLTLDKWLHWLNNCQIERHRPLYYMDYNKAKAMKYLTEKFEWQWYGGHHCENKYTIFIGNHVHPRKFGIDLRLIEFSAMMRSGFMTREQAQKELEKPSQIDSEIIKEVKERLHLSDKELERIMKLPKKTHNDYETYQTEFHKQKAMFTDLYRKGMIPATFYMKYIKNAVSHTSQ